MAMKLEKEENPIELNATLDTSQTRKMFSLQVHGEVDAEGKERT